ncbi:hypothetical protein AB0J86_20685 [Micromonospora sp. NPDC049559]|uniref:hypothetical protein n=1 Tax=Micromonospora sp. NPDC049559 TaxID=3155923 RepID=UPI00342DB91A
MLVVTAATVLSAGCTALPLLGGDRNFAAREVASEPRIRLVTPQTLGGLPQSPSRPLWNASRETLAALRLEVGETTSAIAAPYGGRTETEDAIVVSAAAGTIDEPSALLWAIVAAIDDATDIRPVRPGPLGGDAKCVVGHSSQGKQAVCAWADNDSVGIVRFLSDSLRDRRDEFVEIRAQLEQPAG